MYSKKRGNHRVIRILLAVLLVAAVAGGILLHMHATNVYTIQITLNGDKDMTVASSAEFVDPGATAEFSGSVLQRRPISVAVSTSKAMSGEDSGIQMIKYTAEHKGATATAYRIVRVSDGKNGTDRFPLQKKDTVPPELVLKGGQNISIRQGDYYTDPGFTAWDDTDGDLTDQVEVVGEVKRYFADAYTVTYTVTDSSGNTTSTCRTVRVKPCDYLGAPPEVVIPCDKVIYLTFDDGPGPRTPELLDVLKKYDVKATFFVVNTGCVDTLQRIADEGHSIAIHTASHVYQNIYASEEAYFNDLYKMRDIIKEKTGIETTLLRFPGGSSNTISAFNSGIMTRLTQAVVDRGFQYFDWNVDSNDAGGATSPYEVYHNVINGIQGNNVSVVLQHDIHGFSVAAVERIIIWGLENGYTFLPLQPNSPGVHHGVRN